MEVRVEKLVYGGLGLARDNGHAVLIPFAAPGDRLEVRPVQEKNGYTLAHIEKIIEPSLHRRLPHCPHFQSCGGCQLQHLNYPAQLDVKREFVRESLKRIGGIDWSSEIPVLSGPEYNYRLRAQLKTEADETGHRLGYFKPGSHQLCEIECCPLLSPRLNDALKQVRLIGFDQLKGKGTIDLVQGEDQQIATHPATSLSNLTTIATRVGEVVYHFDAQTFFQVNRFLLEAMVSLVVNDERGRYGLDLYCGVGFFTIPLGRQFECVTGIEGNPRAVRFAQKNAEQNGVPHIRFVAAPVESWFKRPDRLREPVDLVVVDPPRPGLTRTVLHGLDRLRPARITYVSCNPTTLARDLKHLLAHGYRLTSVTAIDLFPQTFHIETIAKLRRH
jgi:23S rRNA (uracil1939-C5)-methyltransferase